MFYVFVNLSDALIEDSWNIVSTAMCYFVWRQWRKSSLTLYVVGKRKSIMIAVVLGNCGY